MVISLQRLRPWGPSLPHLAFLVQEDCCSELQRQGTLTVPYCSAEYSWGHPRMESTSLYSLSQSHSLFSPHHSIILSSFEIFWGKEIPSFNEPRQDGAVCEASCSTCAASSLKGYGLLEGHTLDQPITKAFFWGEDEWPQLSSPFGYFVIFLEIRENPSTRMICISLDSFPEHLGLWRRAAVSLRNRGGGGDARSSASLGQVPGKNLDSVVA